MIVLYSIVDDDATVLCTY